MQLIHIDEFRERRGAYVTLKDEAGRQFAISKDILTGVVKGQIRIDEIEDYNEVLRLIVKDYLRLVEE